MRFATLLCAIAVLITPFPAQAHSFAERIYGGKDATITHTVALLLVYQRDQGSYIFCSGTFLSPVHFLTARHCVLAADFPDPEIYVLFTPDPVHATRAVGVQFSQTEDVAIVEFPPEDVKPLPILKSRTPRPKERLTFFGYGADQRELGPLEAGAPHFLKVGTGSLRKLEFGFFSIENTKTGGACHGDSGGPLTALNGKRRRGIVGIAIFVTGNLAECVARNKAYFLDVRAPSVLNFIRSAAPDARFN